MAELTALQRALRVLQLLSVRDRITVKELYDWFDRRESVRTLQRTLTTIESIGVPIKRETGPHGEFAYSLGQHFQFIPELLSADEALAAILLAQFGEHFAGSPVGESLGQVIEKLEQLLPIEGLVAQSGLIGLSNAFQFKQAGLVPGRSGNRVLLDLLQAILGQKICSVQYRRLGGTRRGRAFKVQPYSLVLVAGAIYLVAYHPLHKTWLHLAIQRLQRVTLEDTSFVRDPHFDLRSFLNGSFGIWQSEPETITIRFSETVAEFIQERVWHPSQRMELLPEGKLDLTMVVGLSSELEAWILRWGAHSEVLAPDSLRQRIRDLLQAAVARYDSPAT